jgi:hypothetical protein
MAVSLLMVIWCISGFVMLYVSFPSVSEAQRLSGLASLDLQGCCAATLRLAIAPDARIDSVRIEMLADHAVAAVQTVGGSRRLIDLLSGAPIARLSLPQAQEVATSFAARQGVRGSISSVGLVQTDQWTVSEQFKDERPMYRFRWSDSAASVVYVSSTSGRVVQFTNGRVRFWNWLGAVPHWLYFEQLREHALLWAQCVIWMSLLGCFLTLIGLYIGVRQFLRRPKQRSSPYRGYMWWHHILGMIFGVILLTWVLSGFFSMTPWGFLEGGDMGAEVALLSQRTLTWGELAQSFNQLRLQPLIRGTVSLRGVASSGYLVYVASYRDAHRIRLNAAGVSTPLSSIELAHKVAVLRGATATLMTRADRYYFDHHSTPVSFPVYRVLASDNTQNRYYIDAVSGEILKKVDPNERGYRWLHQGLHRLDFTAGLRTRPTWDLLMIILLLGATIVSVTGLFSTWLRVTGLKQRNEA